MSLYIISDALKYDIIWTENGDVIDLWNEAGNQIIVFCPNNVKLNANNKNW